MLSPQEFYSTLNDEQKATFMKGITQLSAEHSDVVSKYNCMANKYFRLRTKNAVTTVLLIGTAGFSWLTFKALSNVIKEREELKEQVNTLKNGEEPK